MSEQPRQQHALAAFVDLHSSSSETTSPMSIKALLQPSAGHLNLRGDPTDAQFKTACEANLGQPLPLIPNTISSERYDIYWLGPDEWLVISPDYSIQPLMKSITDSLGQIPHSVNDLSGGQLLIELSGASVTDVLANGCTLDLHPHQFQTGQCAQSNLAKAPVLLGRPRNDDVFTLVVRRSFADYLAQWLRRASAESGLDIQAQ